MNCYILLSGYYIYPVDDIEDSDDDLEVTTDSSQEMSSPWTPGQIIRRERFTRNVITVNARPDNQTGAVHKKCHHRERLARQSDVSGSQEMSSPWTPSQLIRRKAEQHGWWLRSDYWRFTRISVNARADNQTDGRTSRSRTLDKSLLAADGDLNRFLRSRYYDSSFDRAM